MNVNISNKRSAFFALNPFTHQTTILNCTTILSYKMLFNYVNT
jgi:hypothetical protein